MLALLLQYWPVHLLLLIYTALLAHHAWVGNRRTRGIEDYYVGGRSMGGVALGLSFFATYSSTNSFVGFAGQAYDWGIAWLLLAPTTVLMSWLAWRYVAPRLRRFTRELGSLTLPDFIGFRFASPAARATAAVIVLFASLFYMTAVFKGIGSLVQAFLGIRYETAIVLVFAVVTLYTIAGGFISVVRTDAVQGVVMIVAAIVLFGGVVSASGGIASVTQLGERTETVHLLRWNGAVPLVYVLGVLLAGTAKFVTEPRQLSRFYALEDDRAARVGAITSTVSFAVVYSLLVPLGLYARRLLPNTVDTDQIVPQLLTSTEIFAPGVSAFLVVAMVAAAMSSLDSVLLVMASTAERDLMALARGARDDRSELRSTRLWVAVFAALTAIVAINPPGGIVTLTVLSGSIYAACFGPAVLLGLYWRRGNGAAVLASFGVGLTVVLAWPALGLAATVHQIFPAVLLAFASYVTVARLGAPVEDSALDTLF